MKGLTYGMFQLAENTLIVCALKSECSRFIQDSGAMPVCRFTKKAILYRVDIVGRTIFLLTTGVGGAAAGRSIVRASAVIDIKHVVNAGTCAVLDGQMHVPRLITASRVMELYEPYREYPSVPWPGAFIPDMFGTSKGALINTEKRDTIKKQFCVKFADMEAAFLAAWCKENKIPFTLLKCISDGGDERTIQNFQNNLSLCSEMLSEQLLKSLGIR